MIAAQRRGLIFDQVRRQGGVSIGDLADAVGVSLSTVRRDLDYLTSEGYLVRSHGGALLAEVRRTTFEPDRAIGLHVAQRAKLAIGRRAAKLLEAGQSVIFVVLADSSKFAHVAFCEVCPRTRVQTVITDSELAAAHRDSLAELEIETILVEPTEA